MKKTHMLKYIISSIFLFIGIIVQAQTQDTIAKPKYLDTYGLRIGTDLIKASRNLWDKNYTGFEISGDYRYDKNKYIAVEFGIEDKFTEEDQLTFTTKGMFIRAGLDYNVYENWLDMNNMIFVGGRYGFTSMSQTLNSYNIYESNSYFPSQTFYPNSETTGLSAHWLEFVAGVKAEVVKNLYLGFTFRMKYLITQKQPNDFENLYIPGFGKKFSGKIGAGFNYSISYNIPLFKKYNKKEPSE